MSETEIEPEETTETTEPEGSDVAEPEEPTSDETEPAGEADDDETQEPADDAETPAEPDTQLRTEKQLEKAYRDIAKLRETNADRLSKIMGEDALTLIPCPGCYDFAPGFVFPPDVAAPSDEKAMLMRRYLGLKEKRELQPAKHTERCPDCAGVGWVDSGSADEANVEIQCPTCTARGYVFKGQPQPVAATGDPQAPPQVMTGPTVVPAQKALPPELQAYRDKGWMIVEPFQPAQS